MWSSAGADPEVVKKKGGFLSGYADCVNVTDNQTSVVRMSSFSACLVLKGMGLDPVMQMVCRDRNRIAIQSDILGAAALGINNLLCLSGITRNLEIIQRQKMYST